MFTTMKWTHNQASKAPSKTLISNASTFLMKEKVSPGIRNDTCQQFGNTERGSVSQTIENLFGSIWLWVGKCCRDKKQIKATKST